MNKTLELLGATKVIRAKTDLVYKGQLIRGIQRTTVEGKHGAYDVFVTPGEEATVDQVFAREAINSGRAEYVSGGLCDVVPDLKAGSNRYVAWNTREDHVPAFEQVEVLRTMAFTDLYFPPGFTCTLDISVFDKTQFGYLDEPARDSHQFRILKPSPKQMKLDQAEQTHMVQKLWSHVFPAAGTAT